MVGLDLANEYLLYFLEPVCERYWQWPLSKVEIRINFVSRWPGEKILFCVKHKQ